MQDYQREFIRFLVNANVLKFGDFTAKSGRKIPYFINAGEIKTGAQIARLGGFYARAYLEAFGRTPRVLFGPAYKGIPLAVAASVALAGEGLDLPFFFNRKEAKDHGEGGVFVGYTPRNGDEVVIVEDVVTAGTAIRESMELLSALDGVTVAGCLLLVDRGEKGKTERSAVREIEQTYGFPVRAIVTVRDLLAYLSEDPSNAEHVDRIRAYLAVYGASDGREGKG